EIRNNKEEKGEKNRGDYRRQQVEDHQQQPPQRKLLLQREQIPNGKTGGDFVRHRRCKLEKLIDRRHRIGEQSSQAEIMEVSPNHSKVGERVVRNSRKIFAEKERLQLCWSALAASMQFHDE